MNQASLPAAAGLNVSRHRTARRRVRCRWRCVQPDRRRRPAGGWGHRDRVPGHGSPNERRIAARPILIEAMAFEVRLHPDRRRTAAARKFPSRLLVV